MCHGASSGRQENVVVVVVSEDFIIIAGGGIGGLAAALAVAQKGFHALVLEKAPQLGEVGAGIQLGPNAFHALDYLGVGETARKMAITIDSLRLMDALSGTEIARIPLDECFRQRFKNPYAVVHRGDLHAVLLTACDESDLIQLRSNAAIESYEQDEQTVTAILTNAERINGRALIAADGLWSTIRQQLVGDGAPRVSGHSTYRSVIPTEQMPTNLQWNAATLWAGPKCHIVHYPLSGWKKFNLVVTYHNDAEKPVAGKSVSHDEVQRGFEHVHPVARQIIDRGQDWKLWVLCDRDPIEHWVDGRVALLGDAAHPMLQYFAQGACMALEDAVCLSVEMGEHGGDTPAALQNYQKLRYLRTAKVQLMSREIGQHIYHPSGAHAALRNQIMSSKSAQDWLDTIEWLYGATAPSG